ncbi:uncharacterized protein SCHCODRAFT_01067198, partial [Schizophyllum commune H4-8]|uniref:uncharacterized protein n=1 Tax=Schizophyllum commune (strain H4-8 / FGSC 9210) TaxID=578458 RepID=UPI0021603A3E
MSQETKRKLQEFWERYSYLVIDEYSMISKVFLAKLSAHVAIGKNALTKGSFGGISPANRLYHPRHATDNLWMVEGRNIYEEFTDVIILREQMRVVDNEWRTFLSRLRRGDVAEQDLTMLDELPFLITPRHSVRKEWNEAAMRAHCASTRRTLYVCRAQDTTSKGRSLTLAERLALVQRSSGSRKSASKDLPREIQVAVGAQVMVTENIDTDLDIANGARGQIVGIVFNPAEPQHTDDSVVHLRYLPAYVLVKLERTR